MNLDEDLFIEAIEKLERKPFKIALFNTNSEWLREVGVSAEMVGFLSKYSFSSFVQFGCASFSCPNEIRSINTETQILIQNGLLIVGSGLNGDPIVVDSIDGYVGYVSHDVLWEGEEFEIVDIFAKMNETIGSFFKNALCNPEFPVDFYEARESGEERA